MLLDSFSAVGFGPFKKRWSVSVGELRGLIAVTGINGAGKSTFLELGIPGALYRTTPTRGSLADLAVARDACLDVTVVHSGNRWQLRHLVDGQSGKGESLVLGADGQPVLPDTKVKGFDAWAAKTFPAPEVLLSTIFGAQGSGGFLAAKPAERKAILLRVLGVEQLEALAADARERVKVAKAAAETTAARLGDERARAGDVAAVEAELAGARGDLAVSESSLATAHAQLATAQEHAKNYELAVQANAATTRQRADLEQRIAEAQAKAADLRERITNNQGVIADGPAIRAAVARVAELQAEIATVERAAAAAEAEAREALAPWADVGARLAAEETRLQRADERLRDAHAVERAKVEVVALRDAAQEADAEYAKAMAKLEELQATHLAGAEEREQKLLGGVKAVWEAYDANEDVEASDLAAIAREVSDDHAEAVALAQQTPILTREAKERCAAARARQTEAQRQLATAERYAARGPETDAAAVEQADAMAELQRLRAGHTAAREAASAKRLQAEAERARIANLTAESAQHQPTAARAKRLEGAEERLTGYQPLLTEAMETAAKLTGELGACVLAELPPRPDTVEAQQRVRFAQQAADQARAAIARAEQRLDEARASATRRAELEQQLRAQHVELADWTRVVADLGKDGLQALEIDAAGPELTDLTNALLHGCHGPRFTARVETQRASADGKRQLEGCEVVVLDTEQGREASGETFSGGEKVILAEALSLAILVLACRRAGLTDVSLVRDESGAALDPANARVYVAMLRQAMDLIGARHCLLVSHSPEVVAMADHRIEVGAESATEARAA